MRAELQAGKGGGSTDSTPGGPEHDRRYADEKLKRLRE
jgi:hypothetical protein